MSEILKLCDLHYWDCFCHYFMSLFYFFTPSAWGNNTKYFIIIYWKIIFQRKSVGQNVLFDLFSTSWKHEEISLVGEYRRYIIKTRNCKCSTFTDLGSRYTTFNNITMNNGIFGNCWAPRAAKLHCIWQRRSCGALGAYSSFLHSRCVSLSHCALLASCNAEEAPQIIEAVHHHQSLCTVCGFVCVCVLSASLSWGPTNSWATNKHTAATTELTWVPRCTQINQEHRRAFFLFASE